MCRVYYIVFFISLIWVGEDGSEGYICNGIRVMKKKKETFISLDECAAARLRLVLKVATFETSRQLVPTLKRIQLFMPISFYGNALYRDKKISELGL